MRPLIATILSAAILAAAPAAAKEKPTGEEKLAKILEGRVAGEPQDCIYLPRIRSSEIIDGTAIVYDAGSTIYVNRPRNGAYALDDDDIMVTDVHGSTLCSIDVVRLHDRTSFFYDGFVGLDEFVPYKTVALRD